MLLEEELNLKADSALNMNRSDQRQTLVDTLNQDQQLN